MVHVGSRMQQSASVHALPAGALPVGVHVVSHGRASVPEDGQRWPEHVFGVRVEGSEAVVGGRGATGVAGISTTSGLLVTARTLAEATTTSSPAELPYPVMLAGGKM